MKNYNDFSKSSYTPLARISSTYWCINVEELENSFKKIEKIISLPIITLSRYSVFFDKYSNKYDKEIDKNKLKKEISNFKEEIRDLYCYVIFLCIYKTIYNKTHYLIGNNVKELKNFGLDFVSLKFKGEIFIEDYELDAKKFNI